MKQPTVAKLKATQVLTAREDWSNSWPCGPSQLSSSTAAPRTNNPLPNKCFVIAIPGEKSLASVLNTKPVFSVEHLSQTLFRLLYTVLLASKAQSLCFKFLCSISGTSSLGTAQFQVWAPSFPCFLRWLMTCLATLSQAHYLFLTKTTNFSHQMR